MTTNLPALAADPPPLVPADCDCRGLPFMPFEIVRFLESDLVALASPEEGWASLLLWARSWLHIPAGSMKDDDRILAKAAGVSPSEWRSLRAAVLKGWVKADDGLLYHPVVSEKALEAWVERLSFQKRSSAGNAARYGHDFNPGAFDAQILVSLRLLLRLNPKSARELAKAKNMLHLLEGGESAPSGKGSVSLKEAPRREIASEGTGTGKETGKKKEDTRPSGSPAAKASSKAKPAPKERAASTTRGTRLPAGWFANENCRAYAASRGFGPDQIDQIEDDFRMWWPAQPGQKGVKTDWDLTFMTWVRKEEQRNAGRSQRTSAGRGGFHDPDNFRAMHEGSVAASDRRR